MNIVEKQPETVNYLCQGQYSDAIAFYEQCIEANPTYLPNYWQLGLATLLQGDETEAQAIWISILLQGTPEESETWVLDLVKLLKNAVIEQLQSENILLAEKICRQILELAPDWAEGYYYMGVCWQRNHDPSEAISYLKKAIELDLNLAEAYSGIGALLRDAFKDKLDEAIHYLHKAIELKPNLVEAYYNLGICLRDQKDLEQAINALQRTIELKPTFDKAHYELGISFWNHEKLDLAIKSFQKAIGLNPQFAEAHYELGRCFLEQGAIDQAVSQLKVALSCQPTLKTASRIIADLLQCDQSGYAPIIRQGYRIWDAILFKDENFYRLFYLKGDRRSKPFFSVGEMVTATSLDLKKWDYQGVVLQPDPQCEWQSGRILSGSVYKENGIYYLFYAASPPKPSHLNERIGLAKSTDGISWQCSREQLIEPELRFYCTSLRSAHKGRRHFGWRDPYLFKDSITGKYYLFITASCQGKHPKYRGALAVAVSNQIDGPYEVLPPVVYPIVPETEEGIYYELERPQVIYKDGKYHLFFSCGITFINPKWLDQVGREGITTSSLYWYIADEITGPFVPSSAKPVVKGSENTGLYGTSLVEAPDGQLIACGANIYSYTLEVSPRFPVRWENGNIEILVD